MRTFFLVLLTLLLTSKASWSQSPDSSRVLPTHFAADLIWVEPVTASGDTMRFYADTGAGHSLLVGAVERLSLTVVDTAVGAKKARPAAALPEFHPDASIPPTGGQGWMPEGWLPVLGDGGRRDENVQDGFLGQDWFGGRIWTFDYVEKELVLHISAKELSSDSVHTVPLVFKTDSTGRRSFNFPSIEAEIGGETYQFLFDTGAAMVLSDSARSVLGGAPVQATSYIAESVFEEWRAEHPSWRVIEGADRPTPTYAVPIIEVPKVTVAGYTVGPAWFAKRPNFGGSASYTDRYVDGALGGSVFQYFAITMDYPNARATFRRPE